MPWQGFIHGYWVLTYTSSDEKAGSMKLILAPNPFQHKPSTPLRRASFFDAVGESRPAEFTTCQGKSRGSEQVIGNEQANCAKTQELAP
jgi:hypothetical protein